MCAIYTVLVEYRDISKIKCFQDAERGSDRALTVTHVTAAGTVVGSRLCVEGAPEEEAQQHPTGGSGPCRYLITSLPSFRALLLPPKVVSNSKSQLFNLNLRGFHTRLW